MKKEKEALSLMAEELQTKGGREGGVGRMDIFPPPVLCSLEARRIVVLDVRAQRGGARPLLCGLEQTDDASRNHGSDREHLSFWFLAPRRGEGRRRIVRVVAL